MHLRYTFLWWSYPIAIKRNSSNCSEWPQNRFKCEGLSVVLSVDSLPDVGWVGVGEGNSWWLRQFNGVFRYRFGKLDFEGRSFKFIPRG